MTYAKWKNAQDEHSFKQNLSHIDLLTCQPHSNPAWTLKKNKKKTAEFLGK